MIFLVDAIFENREAQPTYIKTCPEKAKSTFWVVHLTSSMDVSLTICIY
jgi:hypothetical protein